MGRTIKNGRFCIYNGNEFKVNRDSDGNTIILTKNDKIIDSTFIDKYGSGVYSKKVSLEEIEELYRYATYAVINNYKVNVEKENQEYYFVEPLPKLLQCISERQEKLFEIRVHGK